MNKPFLGTIILAILLCLGFTSCSTDAETATTQGGTDCAITSIILGSLKRDVHTQTTAGKDSVYTTTLSGSLYQMYIDQYKQEIYNPDSLPIGTHIDKVVFSVARCDGVLAYKTLWGTDTLYTTSDTLDFTTPRTFTCYSYTGTSKKAYTVRVNMHQVDPEKFVWNNVEMGNPSLTDIKTQRAFNKDSLLYIYAITSTDTIVMTSSINDGTQWNKEVLHVNGLTPNSIQLFKGAFYALKQGEIITSTDGKTWTNVGANITADVLPATSGNIIFALKDQKMYYSNDGITWNEDNLEGDASYLPTSNYSSTYNTMNFNSNFEYVIMGGKNAEGSVEWKKIIDNKGDNTEPWSLYNFEDKQVYPYPSMPDTKMLNYDDKIFSAGIEGDTLSLFFVSNDYGRTWIPYNKNYLHPSNIKASNFSWVIDENKYMWIFCGGSGDIWRGRINRLGFTPNKKAFTE